MHIVMYKLLHYVVYPFCKSEIPHKDGKVLLNTIFFKYLLNNTQRMRQNKFQKKFVPL